MKYRNKLVAFIDILGFKDLINQSENDETKIELLSNILNYLKTWEVSDSWGLNYDKFEDCIEYRGIENFQFKDKTLTTTFSDSIVISVELDNNINEMTSSLVSNLAFVGGYLLEQGI